MDIPQLIIGTFQNKNYSELYQVVSAAVEAGFTGFDTAPSYETAYSGGYPFSISGDIRSVPS